MTRMRTFILAGVLACVLFVDMAGPTDARPFFRPFRPVYRPAYPVRPVYNPVHPPGWDWWKIYPWSPYNAWRNPYWYPPYNTNYPYPPYEAYSGNYVTPYYYPSSTTYYAPSTTTYYSGYAGGIPPEDGVPNAPQQRVVIPHPTGALRAPPPNAAVIRVYVPNEFATVLFDGVKSSSVGTTRYYVTPDLEGGKKYGYDVSATFTRNGQPVTEDRHIAVAAGETTVVDFNRAMAK
jgi:uncharacterized protein (TIGR03000 family)